MLVVLWSDIGGRDLSKSLHFHRFIEHLSACSRSGFRNFRLLPVTLLGAELELHHPLPLLPRTSPGSGHASDDSFFQSAVHLASESHLLLDYAIAACDPLYALTPILTFSASTEVQLLGVLQRCYDMIASTDCGPQERNANLEQLILHKHILDEHSRRHEQVLGFLRTPTMPEWTRDLSPSQVRTAADTKMVLEQDYGHILSRSHRLSSHYQEAISILVSSAAIAESGKQIELATKVAKLTVLAAIFLPLSYCASLFGMNFVELEGLSIWIWLVVTLSVALAVFVVYQWHNRHQWVVSLQNILPGLYFLIRHMFSGRPSEGSTV